MGQAKHNPTAIAARNGEELPPREKPMTNAQRRRWTEAMAQAMLTKIFSKIYRGG